jgi:4-hydroxy-4-methyl-2-oxoglutarate aldolase
MRRPFERRTLAAALATLVTLASSSAHAQLGMFSTEQRLAITSEWQGARAEDGRPLVPDSILERMGEVTAEEAWGVLTNAGYHSQFEGGWKTVHAAEPGKRLVGRVVTAVFMPKRPDLDAAIVRKATEEKRVGRGLQNAWVINLLKPGDVLVVDLFGKIDKGTLIGDRLGTSIYAKTGKGLVVNGAVRDPTGLSEIAGFKVFARDFHPSAIADTMLMGWNLPIRIGDVTVLPGDVVVSDPDGLVFIPAHLAEAVADESELTQLRDDWGHQMLREQKYNPGQVDAAWSPKMIDEFNAWAAAKGSKMRMKTGK